MLCIHDALVAQTQLPLVIAVSCDWFRRGFGGRDGGTYNAISVPLRLLIRFDRSKSPTGPAMLLCLSPKHKSKALHHQGLPEGPFGCLLNKGKWGYVLLIYLLEFSWVHLCLA